MILSSILSVPDWIGSRCLHWTSTGTDPNGYTLESDHKLVRICLDNIMIIIIVINNLFKVNNCNSNEANYRQL